MSITEQYNNEIYHYGVKGMKWGVRRDRKSAQKFAKNYYKETKRDGHSANAQRKLATSDTISELYNRSDVKKARDEIRKYDNIQKDFYSNTKLLDKYQRKCAKAVSDKYDISFEDALRGYKNDDFDQGDDNTFDTWLKDTGKLRSYYDGVSKANTQYRKVCREVVDQYLGEYGDMRVHEVPYRTNPGTRLVLNRTMSDVFDDALDYRRWMD